jgi:hypothetical protein
MKFEEALKAMREGKKVKRNPFNDEYAICLGIVSRKYRAFSGSKLVDRIEEISFDTDYLLSEDWEICE